MHADAIWVNFHIFPSKVGATPPISGPIHPAFTSVTAVTVADLGAWCSSARSPKKSPRGKGTIDGAGQKEKMDGKVYDFSR